MGAGTSFFQQLAAEIRRRKILRVLAGYAVGAWLILQIGEVTFEPLGLPEWSMRALILAVIIGFPLSVILAWIIDIRPEGLIFDLPLWASDESAPRNPRRTDFIYLLIPATLLVGGALQGTRLLLQSINLDSAVPSVQTDAGVATIAVLAFEDFSDDPEAHYFAAGLAEEVLILLNDVPQLKVAARSSSFQFTDQQIDVRDIAQRLGVQHLLEGGVRRSGDRLRVTVRLVDGQRGLYGWSEVFDRRISDVFDIQRDVALAVVRELKLALSLDVEQKLNRQPTDNVDAYLAFLQGREQLRSSIDADVVRSAVKQFEVALTIDPDFARAHAGVCEAMLRLYDISNDVADFDGAERACTRAAELDPQLVPETRIALAALNRFRGRLDKASDLVEQAILKAPDNASAFRELGIVRSAQSRPEEAEAAFKQAVTLKPSDWRIHSSLATFLYREQRFAEAAERYEEVTRLAPRIAAGFSSKGAAYWMLQDFPAAEAAFRRSLELKPSREGYTNMGLRFYYAGLYDEAANMQREALKYAPDDHRVWGRLAESLRFSSAESAGSLDAYQRARELALGNLEVNPTNWTNRGLLALYLAHLGDPSAVEQAAQAVAQSDGDPEALYYEALVLLQLGDPDAAVDRLARAVTADPGYARFLRDDPDLAQLHQRADFSALLPPASAPEDNTAAGE